MRRSLIYPILLLAVLSGCGTTTRDTMPLVRLTPARAGMNPDLPLDQFTVSNWSTRNGLPQNSVQAILQTSDGYIWLGTQEGLVRFNGTEFETYDRSNTPELLSNDIMELVEDASGALWIGTVGGGVLRKAGLERTAYTTANGLSGNTVSTLAMDDRGGVWIGTSEQGLNYLTDGEITSYLTSDGLPDDRIRSLLIDHENHLWVGTVRGLAVIEDASIRLITLHQDLAESEITDLALSSDGSIWAGTTRGLYRITQENVRRYDTTDGLSNAWIMSLCVDVNDTVIIGTVSGVSRYSNGSFTSILLAPDRAGNIIASLFVDRDGSLWIGTVTTGLAQMKEAAIVTYTEFHGLASNILYAVAESRAGGLWLGSHSGDIDRYLDGEITPLLAAASLESGRLRALHEDSQGRLWIGTDTALHVYHAGALRTFTAAEGLPGSSIRAITETQDGSIWVGTDGTGLFQVVDDKIVLVHTEPELPSLTIRAIHEDRHNNLWIGTYGGLVRYRDGVVTSYTTENGFPHDMVRTIHESEDGILWIGTYGGGLIRFQDGIASAITSREGLHNDSIYTILEDNAGNLWMSSNTGIFGVSRSDLDAFAIGQITQIESVSFNESDGMRNRECNGGSPAGARLVGEEYLWFPTIEGLAMLDPTAGRSPSATPVVIEHIVVDSEELDPGLDHRLSTGWKRIEFEYTALNFITPEKMQYQYILEGYDDNWVDARSRKIAQYTGLRPGNYRFRVRVVGLGESPGAYEASRGLTVAPAIYETIWFYLILSLILSFISYTAYRRRIRGLVRAEQLLQERVQKALMEVNVLKGMLPICSFCKKIRDDSGYWKQLEVYIGDHSEAEFSHSLCPECIQIHYPEVGLNIGMKQEDPTEPSV